MEESFKKEINNICTEPCRVLVFVYDGTLMQCE